jgi:hypothetical protein
VTRAQQAFSVDDSSLPAALLIDKQGRIRFRALGITTKDVFESEINQLLSEWLRIMTWNYRLVHQVVNGEDVYAIHEAYYDGEKPISITEESVNPQGETFEELKCDFVYYLKALELPVLEYADFDTSDGPRPDSAARGFSPEHSQ